MVMLTLTQDEAMFLATGLNNSLKIASDRVSALLDELATNPDQLGTVMKYGAAIRERTMIESILTMNSAGSKGTAALAFAARAA